MKVLWIANSSGLYEEETGQSENVAGTWITSLQRSVLKESGVDLALAFIDNRGGRKVKGSATTYYILNKCPLLWRFSRKKQEDSYTSQILRVIEDFKPDLIEVFGTEKVFGLAYRVTNKPIVIHIQGWMHPIHDARYPPYYNVSREWLKALFSPKMMLAMLYTKNALCWEDESCNHMKYFLGRTEWDRRVTAVLAPKANYYYCAELLRPTFYECAKWYYNVNRPMYIVSIINDSPYKGADVILRTAALLKRKYDFKWIVCGVRNVEWAERLTGINAQEVNVECKGSLPSVKLIEHLQKCTCYVHLSYIENSPNSICEAQLTGVPVVAANVGGISSIVEDGKTGLLVPANDAYSTYEKICTLKDDMQLSTRISQESSRVAEARHEETMVIRNLMHVYEIIIQQNNRLEE